jgi:hypothetical protein
MRPSRIMKKGDSTMKNYRPTNWDTIENIAKTPKPIMTNLSNM